MLRYFDIGTMDGQEIDTMVRIVFPTVGMPYEIYGFEGCKESYEIVSKRFPKAKLYHMLIADFEGQRKLFHTTNRSGHSIYKTKKRVISEDGFEMVKCTRFSKWLKDNFSDLDKTFNILRYNIEGAELDLFRDLGKEGMFRYFKIIKGCAGFDILKCKEIAHLHKEFQEICDRNKIPRDHRWSWADAQKMVEWIRNPKTSLEYDNNLYEFLVKKVKKVYEEVV